MLIFNFSIIFIRNVKRFKHQKNVNLIFTFSQRPRYQAHNGVFSGLAPPYISDLISVLSRSLPIILDRIVLLPEPPKEKMRPTLGVRS